MGDRNFWPRVLSQQDGEKTPRPQASNMNPMTIVFQDPVSPHASRKSIKAIRSHAKKALSRKARLKATEAHRLGHAQASAAAQPNEELDISKRARHAASPGTVPPRQTNIFETWIIGSHGPRLRRSHSMTSPYIPSLNRLDGSGVDPFNQVSITLDKDVQIVLQYFNNFALPIAATHAFDDPSTRHSRLAGEQVLGGMLRAFLPDEISTISFLAMTAARIQAYHPGVLSATCSTRLYVRALKQLRHFTRQTPDYRILYTVGCLSGVAVYSGDWVADRAHIKAWTSLLDIVAPYTTLEEARQSAFLYDVLLTMYSGVRPQITPLGAQIHQAAWPIGNPSSETDHNSTAFSVDTSPSEQTHAGSVVGSHFMLHATHINTKHDEAQFLKSGESASKNTARVYHGPGSTETTCTQCPDLCWEFRFQF